MQVLKNDWSMMFREPEDPEVDPFRNYRHTVSVVALPAFVCTLLLMLASVQPTAEGIVPLWVWCLVGVMLVLGVSWGVGRLAVRYQTRHGNPHCATHIGRTYMQLVFVCTLSGLLGVGALVYCVLSGRLWLHVSLLLPSMLAAVTVALILAGVVWQLWGRRGDAE